MRTSGPLPAYSAVASTLLLMIMGAPNYAVAQTSVDRSFDPAPKDCADVRWSQAALEEFPSIAEACQAVEERNGKTYVKLEGTVEEVNDGGKRIRVDFEDGSELTFTPTPHTALYINGDRTEFGKLDEGTDLNFYIPEDRLQAELQPDPARMAFVVIPLDVTLAPIPAQEQSVAQSDRDEQQDSMTASNELPSTAGPLPYIAFGGVILVLLGAGATLARRLRS